MLRIRLLRALCEGNYTAPKIAAATGEDGWDVERALRAAEDAGYIFRDGTYDSDDRAYWRPNDEARLAVQLAKEWETGNSRDVSKRRRRR